MKFNITSALIAGALMASVLPGCANKVSGTVDGEKAKVKSGFFTQNDDLGIMVVTLSGIKNACEEYTAANDEYDSISTAAEAADVYAAHFPADYWEMQVVMVTDPNSDLTDEVLDGITWDAFPSQDQAYVSFTHYTQLLDEAFFSFEADSDAYLDLYYSDGGDLTINSHEPGASLGGTFVTSAASADDGSDVGDVEVNFKVERCTALD